MKLLRSSLWRVGRIFFGLFMLAVLLDPSWLPNMQVIDYGGAVFAMSAIAGGEVTEKNYNDNASELLERSVDDLVVMYKPDRFPLTTMMQNMKKAKQGKARKEEWVEVGYHARKTNTTGSTTAGTGGNAVTINVTDGKMWGPGDLIYIPEVTYGTPAVEFKGYVESVNASTGDLDIVAVNGDNVPAIGSDVTAIRMSRAEAARAASTQSKGAQGITLWNYHQTFMEQISIEKIVQKIKTYMNDDQVQNDLTLFDFRNSRENARLFGPRNKFTNNDGDDIYTMGGVELFAGKSATYTTAGISNSEWIDICKKAFQDDAGSEQRLLVGGADLIASISKVPSVEKQLESMNTEMVLGVQVNKIETMFGELLIKYHKGFNENNRGDLGYILDMNHINDIVLEPMETTDLELDKTGVARVDATRLLETATLQVRYPDTHTILTPA